MSVINEVRLLEDADKHLYTVAKLEDSSETAVIASD